MRTGVRSVHCVVSTGEMRTAKVTFSHVRCPYFCVTAALLASCAFISAAYRHRHRNSACMVACGM